MYIVPTILWYPQIRGPSITGMSGVPIGAKEKSAKRYYCFHFPRHITETFYVFCPFCYPSIIVSCLSDIGTET